jgi:hypothetical protein
MGRPFPTGSHQPATRQWKPQPCGQTRQSKPCRGSVRYSWMSSPSSPARGGPWGSMGGMLEATLSHLSAGQCTAFSDCAARRKAASGASEFGRRIWPLHPFPLSFSPPFGPRRGYRTPSHCGTTARTQVVLQSCSCSSSSCSSRFLLLAVHLWVSIAFLVAILWLWACVPVVSQIVWLP